MFQFLGWCHLMTVSKMHRISLPETLPDCLTVIVLQRIMEQSSLNYQYLNYAILNKNENKQIEKIVKKNKKSINEIDDCGMTPIEVAISLGDISIVECLIQNGANINDKNILIHAMQQTDDKIAMLLFDKNTDFRKCFVF